MPSVLQDWVEKLSWKKQTVLLVALRAPDTLTTQRIRQIVVWLRAVILCDADPTTGFMDRALQQGLPSLDHIDREFERLSLHAAHHIILSMQVIGNEHPAEHIATTARKFYENAVDAQHLNSELRGQYEERMADNIDRIEIGTN